VFLTEDAEILEARHLSFLEFPDTEGLSRESNGSVVELPNEGIDLEGVVRDLIRQAMQKSGGNKAKAARLLGISKPTLIYRLQKLGLNGKPSQNPGEAYGSLHGNCRSPRRPQEDGTHFAKEVPD
jgi:transcriptional regulator with PAS, ATPase and Fis domain